jgi:hypothetical protein
MKIDANDFWGRVEELWKKTGVTKQVFCNSTNGKINFYTWSNKKSQSKIPNLELASAFAEALGVSLDFLVTGKEYEHPLQKKFHDDEFLIDICTRISKCSREHLKIIDTMIDSWGYSVPEVVQSKGLA